MTKFEKIETGLIWLLAEFRLLSIKKQANSEKMKRLCFIKEWHFALRLNP
ncbi:unknown [Bacteroides sp. CAG:189]|nr:hypothetical protein HMPREF1532_00345 [Bacteroides salyersiae WAL 10018 = DSM 18765 = JCM 12988]CCY52477.1 unknown [Bacteroides sp. CAG:189]